MSDRRNLLQVCQDAAHELAYMGPMKPYTEATFHRHMHSYLNRLLDEYQEQGIITDVAADCFRQRICLIKLKE
jgi:hypothetical protein